MAIAATVNTDKKMLMRDKRAQGIAAMGLVNREGDRFRVTTPSLRGRRSSYEVWRDEAGKVRCSCLEFEEESAQEAGFRCEHILAVKHSLLAKNSEPVTKQPPEKPVAGAAAHPRSAPSSRQSRLLKPTLQRVSDGSRSSFWQWRRLRGPLLISG
jgi:hypothetical protein